MANIIDYLDWRGDVLFTYDGYNEVDGLVLSQLAYLQLEGILDDASGSEKTIREIGEAYFSMYSKEMIAKSSTLFQNSSKMLEKCLGSKRYADVKVSNYRSEYDPEHAKQFGAMTFELQKGIFFVAFRGTDDTLAGWQEDFQVCYTMPVASQIVSEEYLNEVLPKLEGHAYIGGHSKGGNLAMYSSMRLPSQLKNKILAVFNYDGPGFMEDVVLTPEYLEIKDRIHSYMPVESIVGQILYHDGAYTIVKCTDHGVMQHTPLTWQLISGSFETEKEFKNASKLFNAAVRKWISEISDEEREFFVELVFSTLETGGDSFIGMVSNPKDSMTKIWQTYRGLDKDTKKMARNIIGQLVKLSTVTVKENIMGGIAENEETTSVSDK